MRHKRRKTWITTNSSSSTVWLMQQRLTTTASRWRERWLKLAPSTDTRWATRVLACGPDDDTNPIACPRFSPTPTRDTIWEASPNMCTARWSIIFATASTWTRTRRWRPRMLFRQSNEKNPVTITMWSIVYKKNPADAFKNPRGKKILTRHKNEIESESCWKWMSGRKDRDRPEMNRLIKTERGITCIFHLTLCGLIDEKIMFKPRWC